MSLCKVNLCCTLQDTFLLPFAPPCVHQTFIARRIYIHIRNNRLRIRPPAHPRTSSYGEREPFCPPPISSTVYTGCALARENRTGLFLAFYAAGEGGIELGERERWGRVSISTVLPSSSFPFLPSFRVENQPTAFYYTGPLSILVCRAGWRKILSSANYVL